METVRRGLAARVVGRRVCSVEVGRERTVRRTSADALRAGLLGAVVTDATRRGKYIVCPLDNGRRLMIHLRMSGQLLIANAGVLRPPHTHVVIGLSALAGGEPEELRFVDPRTFGEMVVFHADQAATLAPELARLGVDPIVDGLSPEALRRLLGARRRGVKALLLDQTVIAGIGNIYADEILHRAGLHPERLASSLRVAQSVRLHDALHSVLGAAVAARGSTLGDAQYVDLMGEAGSFQAQHRVVGRAGQPCLTCAGGVLVRQVTAGRSTVVCPRCQPRPRRPRRLPVSPRRAGRLG